MYRRFAAAGSDKPLLDAGCGTGGLLARLASAYPGKLAVGLDFDRLACRRAREKSGSPACAGSVNALPFAEQAFGAIFSADVLCHRGVDEGEALAQFRRCLGEGGTLILNLPAYRWMMSRHDVAVSNASRYTKRGLLELLRRAGFRPIFATYWNMLLFPVMVISRKLLPNRGAADSDVHPYPAAIDLFCRAVTGFERMLLRCGAPLPFGGSVLAVAVKEATQGAESA